MIQHGIKRLPLVDASGHLVSIVSCAPEAELPAEAHALPAQPPVVGDIVMLLAGLIAVAVAGVLWWLRRRAVSGGLHRLEHLA